MGSGATPSGLDPGSVTPWLRGIGQIATLLSLSFPIGKMGITTPNSNGYTCKAPMPLVNIHYPSISEP